MREREKDRVREVQERLNPHDHYTIFMSQLSSVDHIASSFFC